MNPSGVVHDCRGVDPIAYIRAVGMRPEDSYGFLPLDLHDSASYLFLYRDDPSYAELRAGLPEAGSVRNINLGLVVFDVGSPRRIGVEVGPQGVGAHGDEIAQALAMQQAWMGGAGLA